MSVATATTPGLAAAEYARRKYFLESLANLTKSEYAEIVRILNKHAVNYNENLNGIFFNVAALPQVVFDELEEFIRFTHSNRLNLLDRDSLLENLKRELAPSASLAPTAPVSNN